jgi:hypothetical protein
MSNWWAVSGRGSPPSVTLPIELQPTETKGGAGSRAGHPPPEHRAEAGQELPGLKGLREVVVGPELEADDAVGGVTPGGEHEHGHVALRPQAPQHLEAVQVRQHAVEDDRVEAAPPGREAGGAVEALLHGEARRAEVGPEHAPETLVVVDDQDAGAQGDVTIRRA